VELIWKKKRKKIANAIKRSPAMLALHQKVNPSQKGARSSSKPTQGAGSSSQTGAAEKSRGGRNSQ
jgi:hypothetical protein